MDSNSRRWSSLPGDLLCMIVGCFESRIDILRFRRVCYSWWSSVPLPSPPPSLKLPYLVYQDTNPNTDFSGHCILTESFVYSIQPPPTPNTQSNSTSSSSTLTKPWIVRIQYLEAGKLVFKDLRSFASVRDVDTALLPNFLDLLDYGVTEIGRIYSLDFVDDSTGSGFNPRRKSPSAGVTEVAVSSNFGKIGDGFTVMALKYDGMLAVWRIGEDRWIDVGDTVAEVDYLCITFHRGKFYAFGDNKLTVSIDPVSLNVSEIDLSNNPGDEKKLIVEPGGDLILVERWMGYYCDESDFPSVVFFEIRKLDEEKRRWVDCDLSDFFVITCDGWSLMVLWKECFGYNDNCIYPANCCSCDSSCNDSCFGIVVYSVGRDTDPVSSNGCSKLFWPPPSWLLNRTK